MVNPCVVMLVSYVCSCGWCVVDLVFIRLVYFWGGMFFQRYFRVYI